MKNYRYRSKLFASDGRELSSQQNKNKNESKVKGKAYSTPMPLNSYNQIFKAFTFRVIHDEYYFVFLLGMSYNPSYGDHQNLLQEVANKELILIKEEKHLKRVTSKMFSRVTEDEKEVSRCVAFSNILALH